MLKTLKDYILLIVRPSWKPLLWGIVAMIALGVASNVFARSWVPYDGLDQSIEYVERNRSNLRPKDVEYCNGMINIGRLAILMRDEGLKLQDALDDLRNSHSSIKKKHGNTFEQSTYLEFERMIQTVFRHPKMDVEAYNQQFFAECITIGIY